MYIQFTARKNVMGLFLENILLALFSSFRLNQLAIHGRRWFGFLVGGDSVI